MSCYFHNDWKEMNELRLEEPYSKVPITFLAIHPHFSPLTQGKILMFCKLSLYMFYFSLHMFYLYIYIIPHCIFHMIIRSIKDDTDAAEKIGWTYFHSKLKRFNRWLKRIVDKIGRRERFFIITQTWLWEKSYQSLSLSLSLSVYIYIIK